MTEKAPHPGEGRVRAAFRAGSWCLVALGGGHLAFMTTVLVRGPGGDERLTLQAMGNTASSSLLGIPRNLLALFYGFSVAMALLAMAVGAVNLVAERLAPEVLTRGTGLLRLDLAVSLFALAVSVLAFPAPAVAILTLACISYAGALVNAIRNRPENLPT
jgi:hypothetical protein